MVRTRSYALNILSIAAMLAVISVPAFAEDKERDAFLRKPVFQNNSDTQVRKDSGATPPQVISEKEAAQRRSGTTASAPAPDPRAPAEATPEPSPTTMAAEPATVPPSQNAPPTVEEAVAEGGATASNTYNILGALVLILASLFLITRFARRKR